MHINNSAKEIDYLSRQWGNWERCLFKLFLPLNTFPHGEHWKLFSVVSCTSSLRSWLLWVTSKCSTSSFFIVNTLLQYGQFWLCIVMWMSRSACVGNFSQQCWHRWGFWCTGSVCLFKWSFLVKTFSHKGHLYSFTCISKSAFGEYLTKKKELN